ANPLGGGGADNPFAGTIDEVMIFDRALTAEEIQATMHSRLTGNEPNLVGYWDFDEGEGQFAYDLTDNGNDGQLGSTAGVDSSDPAWVDSVPPVGICYIVEVDIKPGSCPNPLNLKSEGVLSVAILGSEDFDVTTIDPGSIFLEGVPTIRTNYEVAFWANAKTQLLGLLQEVPADPDTIIVQESTANGVGGAFYETYWQAVERLRNNPEDYAGYIPIFLPWQIFPEYQTSLPSELKGVLNLEPEVDEYFKERMSRGLSFS
ncbi:unnamed protein product, partial [marine sediment metagenome]